MSDLETVSYTHLDVYKRQDVGAARRAGGIVGRHPFVQPHIQKTIDGHQDGGLACFYDRVLAGDEELAGCASLNQAVPSAGLASVSVGSIRVAPDPAPTTRTAPYCASASATAAAFSGREITATFGPASAVAYASTPASRSVATASKIAMLTGEGSGWAGLSTE